MKKEIDWQAEYQGKYDLMIERGYKEVLPAAFYRDLFPKGSLQQELGDGKGNIIVKQLRQEKNIRSPYWIVGDDLNNLDKAFGDSFGLIYPISFFGKRTKGYNAHELFAMVIDIDEVEVRHLKNLLKQFGNGVQLKPTYLISSGHGVHLYYFLEKPLPMYHEKERIYSDLKRAFIRRLWNDTVSGKEIDKDITGILQGFRAVGGLSKLGEGFPVRAFKLSDNRFTLQQIKDAIPECKVDLSDLQKKRMPLIMARLKYPEWYQRKIEKKEQPRQQGEFTQHRRLYEWWKRKMQQDVRSGGRYYSIMALCSFGLKCGISDREIRRDARGFLDYYESLTEDESNHFSAQDIEDALRALKKENRDLTKRASRQWIEDSTKVNITPQIRRNGRKRKDHLEIIRAIKAIQKKNGNLQEGRPSKAAMVTRWRLNNPEGSKADCIKETGLSKHTVYKHWQQGQQETQTIPEFSLSKPIVSISEINNQIEIMQNILDAMTVSEQKEWYRQNEESVNNLMQLLEEYTQE